MSLDATVMDLSQVFEFGQGYVALSRVRRLSGLYLLGINDHALKVHPEILEKDIYFKDKSEEAIKVFNKLSQAELKEMHENFVVACGGKVKSSFAKASKDKEKKKSESNETGLKPLERIREKHQNAYKKWTTEEEAEIVSHFKNGKSVRKISEISGRQVGGIRARLVKLGLIDDPKATS
jgi:hypothetical protein